MKSFLLFLVSALVLGSIAFLVRRPATPKVSEPFLIGIDKPSIGVTTNGQLRTNGFIDHELAEAMYKWAASQSKVILHKWDGKSPFRVVVYGNNERVAELTNCSKVVRCDSTCIRVSYIHHGAEADFHAFGTQVVISN